MLTAFIPAALKPWAKAINAFLSAGALIILHGVITGEWDPTAIEALIASGLLGAIVFATPNTDEAGVDGDDTLARP